jgi:ribosomal-protein-alanine N-acetyltransferase
MKSIGTKTIETERLILRRMTDNDAEDMFYGWAGDEDVTKYLTWQTHAGIETSKEYISSVLENLKNPDYYEWIIEYKETGRAVGSICCININKNINSAEAGYCLSKKYWNLGIASEALRAVLKFMFEEVEINRMEAYHNTENPASGKVMQKAGMIFEGIKRQGAKDNKGCLTDIACYSILKTDFAQKP